VNLKRKTRTFSSSVSGWSQLGCRPTKKAKREQWNASFARFRLYQCGNWQIIRSCLHRNVRLFRAGLANPFFSRTSSISQ
jgi:hypothetical protein